MAVHRNRVIYQSEALFISPDSTGYHFTGSKGSATHGGIIEMPDGSSHPGPWGLMTPPINHFQAFGDPNPAQLAASPKGTVALNGSSHAVGWQCGDDWPNWNPRDFGRMPVDGGDIGEKSTNDIGNAVAKKIATTMNVQFDAVVPGIAGDVTINADGAKNLNTLISEHNTASGPAEQLTVTADDGSFVPDAGTFTLANGRDPVKARGFGVGGALAGDPNISVFADDEGVAGNDITFAVVQGAAGAGAESSITGTDITITVDIAGGATVADVIAAAQANGNITALIDISSLAGPGVPPAAVAFAAENLVNGDDGALSQLIQNNVVGDILDDPSLVQIQAVLPGTTLNNEIIFGPGTAASPNDVLTVTQLVAAWNNAPANADPFRKIEILSGADTVLDDSVVIRMQENGRTRYADNHGSIIKQLKRVQTANYGFTINRQDINQFGHAARLDSIVVESPTVNLDFSYFLLDGFNERMLEFVTNGAVNTISGMLTPELYQAGNNFFILTAPESRDVVKGDKSLNADGLESQKSVIALGNGYITDYSIDIAVGAIPTANVTVEGMNIKSDFQTTGNDLPAMDMRDGSKVSDAWLTDANGDRQRGVCNPDGCTGLYSLPAASSGYTGCEGKGAQDVAALRPGDVVVDLSSRSLISKSVSGNANTPVIGSAHVQSTNISLPLGRTTLQRLGSVFGFSKAIDLPLSVSMSVNALVADLKEGDMLDLLCDCSEFDVGVTLFKPECQGCTVKDITDPDKVALKYILKGARLDSENFSSSIGDNKSVDLVFSTQVGSSDDSANGLYISGSEARERSLAPATKDIAGLPPAWTGIGGQTTGAISGYLFGYRP